MKVNTPSFFLLAIILAVSQSATSHPIRTSKWIKTAQFPDPNARGTWKVFEKESFDQLPDPPHVTYDQNPAWESNHDNDFTKQEPPSSRYIKGTAESGKPTVSVLIPTSSGTEPEHSHHDQDVQDEHEHQRIQAKESSINALNAIAAQRQAHYSKILKYLHAKHALYNKPSDETSSSIAASSGHSIAFFAFRFSLPMLGSKSAGFPHYQLPGVYTAITVLLVLVWIAIFIIGLVELGNYVWKRRDLALRQDEHIEERSVGLDEAKVTLSETLDAPWETRPQSGIERVCTFLEPASDSDSDSGSEDEDDYCIFE